MKKEKKERSGIVVDGYFDIETEEWSTFVMGGLLVDGIFKSYDDEDSLAAAIFAHEGDLWAHNGGRYDALWLLKMAVKQRITAKVWASSARITLLQFGKLKIRDSAALAPMTLDGLAQIAGKRKTSTGLTCVCGTNCGGYCAIRRDMSRESRELLRTYLENDCRAGYEGLLALEDYAIAHELDLRGTIGASSWSTAARKLGLPAAEWSGRDYKFARSGYYGGRTQVGRPVSPSGRRCDVNSAYIAALSEIELPVGAPRELAGDDARRAFLDGAPGIYYTRAHVPESMHVPPLPYRLASGRVAYPVGEVSGTWTGLELDYACARGVTLDRFGKALVWPLFERALAPMADMVWGLRADAGKKSAIGKWCKWFGNSLTGKLAQKPDAEEIVIAPDNPEPCPGGTWCGGDHRGPQSRCCEHRCMGNCGAYTPFGRGGVVWTRPVWRVAANAHVQWAAYLTARARTQLHRQIISDGLDGRTWVYCDTDSCYASRPRTWRIGAELGDFLDEGPYRDFHALAPKLYRYVDESGEEHVTAKGFVNPSWQRIVSGEPLVADRGVMQFRSAVKAGVWFERKRIVRHAISDGKWFGDRFLGEDGLTHPATIAQLELAKR